MKNEDVLRDYKEKREDIEVIKTLDNSYRLNIRNITRINENRYMLESQMQLIEEHEDMCRVFDNYIGLGYNVKTIHGSACKIFESVLKDDVE